MVDFLAFFGGRYHSLASYQGQWCLRWAKCIASGLALKKMAGTKILPLFHFLITFQGGPKICQTLVVFLVQVCDVLRKLSSFWWCCVKTPRIPGFLDSFFRESVSNMENTAPKTERLNTQNDGSMVNVSPASNMAMFGIYVKFLVGTTLASQKNNKNLQSRLAKHTTWHHFAATNSLIRLFAHIPWTILASTFSWGGLLGCRCGLPAIELGEAIAIAMIKFQSVMTCDIFPLIQKGKMISHGKMIIQNDFFPLIQLNLPYGKMISHHNPAECSRTPIFFKSLSPASCPKCIES